MKIVVGAALIVAQFAAPVFAASAATPLTVEPDGSVRAGAFAGGRIRIGLGGKHPGRIRAGLTLASTQRSLALDGRETRRFGDGLELGFATGEPFAARLAGTRLTPGPAPRIGDDRLGVSTIGAAGIVGGVIVAGLVIYALAARGDPD